MLACPEKPYVKVRHTVSFFVDFWAFLIDYLEVCNILLFLFAFLSAIIVLFLCFMFSKNKVKQLLKLSNSLNFSILEGNCF